VTRPAPPDPTQIEFASGPSPATGADFTIRMPLLETPETWVSPLGSRWAVLALDVDGLTATHGAASLWSVRVRMCVRAQAVLADHVSLPRHQPLRSSHVRCLTLYWTGHRGQVRAPHKVRSPRRRSPPAQYPMHITALEAASNLRWPL
jgi:hypothetical protein